MKKLLLSILLILSISCLSACGNQSEVMGYWLSSDGEFYHFDVSTVTTGLYDTENIENTVYSYNIYGDVIEFTRENATYKYNYKVNTEDNTLSLTPVTDSSEKIILYGTNSVMQEEIIVGLKIQNS